MITSTDGKTEAGNVQVTIKDEANAPNIPGAGTVRNQAAEIKGLSKKIVKKAGGKASILVFASIIIIIDASIVVESTRGVRSIYKDRGMRLYDYMLALGVICLVTSGIFLLLQHMDKLDDKVRKAFVLFLFVWNLIGFCVGTFVGPYIKVGNGFFSLWALWIVSALMVRESFEEQTMKVGASVEKLGYYLGPILVASAINLAAAIEPCRYSCAGAHAFAVAVGVVSIVVCIGLGLLKTKLDKKVFQLISGFLTIWWFFGVCVGTFGGPWYDVGNGYVSCYAAFFISILNFIHTFE